ncbi:MAG: hypothetical protein JXO49_00320 [Deltaproteobacteria bacterium]|nr:hypothetical protein [Candidatus Anaeroferrophillus wilburensis]MBN2887768.1 hypothetical protein [Deltaproteobacteria bacterium]
MTNWHEAVRIFTVGFTCVFVILGLLVVSLSMVNGMIRRLPSAKAKQ